MKIKRKIIFSLEFSLYIFDYQKKKESKLEMYLVKVIIGPLGQYG